jgi:ABC-type Na+ efflux pump permease subunit
MKSLSRISILARHTFTQLVRMRIFYFLLVFFVLIYVAGFMLASVSVDQELKLLKDTAFGVMQLFSCIFGIMGMAFLLPKDIEDRTLYTILSKPVQRWEYLLGKYFGVLLVLLACLLLMNVLSMVALQGKYTLAQAATKESFEELRQNMPAAQVDDLLQEALNNLSVHAPSWGMQWAMAAIFLKAAVATAVALVLSTIAGSTIFTILAAFCVYAIGHMQSTARDALLSVSSGHHGEPTGEKASVPVRLGSGVVAIVFPDFEVYNVVDAIVGGKKVPGSAYGKMLGLSGMYLSIYLGIGMMVFSRKEL